MGRYLLAGTAGFIGSRVAEMLLTKGHQVFGVDNLDEAYDVRMKTYRLSRLQGLSQFTFQRLDIAEAESIPMMVAAAPFDGVFNLAARAGVRSSVIDPWGYVETNLVGTLNLLETCRQAAIPKFILASTSSIYGNDAPLPTPETANSDLPLQPYAASKKGAEAMCHAYHYLHGIDVTVFRYFTVYGPAGRPDMSMFRFTKWISEGEPLLLNGDGTQSRGFTYIDDIACGTIAGLKPVGYEIVNLGGHQVITINQLIEMLEARLGRKAIVQHLPFPKADMVSNHADVEKAGRLLGWEAQVPLEEGINQLVAWYLAERDWARHISVG